MFSSSLAENNRKWNENVSPMLQHDCFCKHDTIAHFTAEQPDGLASVGNSLASGPPPPLDCSLPHAGLQLGSGRWVSALVYADDVVLLSWTAAGATGPSGQHACLLLGLEAHHQPFKDRGCCLQWQQL